MIIAVLWKPARDFIPHVASRVSCRTLMFLLKRQSRQRMSFDFFESVETLTRFRRRPVKATLGSLFVSTQSIDQQAFIQSPLQPCQSRDAALCENAKQCLSASLVELTPSPDGVFCRRFPACLWPAIALLGFGLLFLTTLDVQQVVRPKHSLCFFPFLDQAAGSTGSTLAADRSVRICRRQPGRDVLFSIMTTTVGWTFTW